MANRYQQQYAPPEFYSGSGSRGGSIADIILRGGDAQAQAHLARGQIFADTIRGVGDTVAGAIQQRAEQKEIAKRDQAWLSFIDSGAWQDPKEAALGTLRIWGPGEEGQAQLRALGGIMQLGQQKRDPEADQKALTAIGSGMARMTDSGRAMAWPQAHALLQRSMPELAAQLPAEYDPKVWQELAPLLSGPEGAKPTIVPGNARLVGPDNQILVDVAPSEPKTPSVGSFEDYVVQKFGPRPTPNQIATARREYAQADNAPAASGPRPLTQTAEAGLIARWAKEYDTAAKPARDLNRALSMMDAGLKSAKAGDLNAGSQAVLVTFQKILDPTSVVRESEYARSAQGLALLDRIAGYAQRITQGGPGVPVSELEEFARVGRQFVEGYNKHAEGVKSRIGKAADRYGIPQELIFSDYDAPAAPSAAPPAPPAANAAPPRPAGVPANAKWDPARGRWVL